MTVITVRSVSFCLPVLLFLFLNDIDAYPSSDFDVDRDEFKHEFEDSWPLSQLAEGNDFVPRKEVLQKMQEILGIQSRSENLAHHKVPPQFMMELYHTVADPNGVTRGRNPYNARVVRSFVERGDTSQSHLFFFNISGLEINESVLEAELHLYRKKTPLRQLTFDHLTITSPYYLIRVYQVLDNRSLDTPDLHRLLNVRYVGEHAFGWQVLNVKEAVVRWVSGEPNLGLLVTATNLFEDKVSMEFLRRNDNHHSKQPILVLFDASENQDDKNREDELAHEKNARSEKIDQEDNRRVEYFSKYKGQRDGGQIEEVLLTNRHQPEFFQRQKRRHEEEDEEFARHDDSQGQRRRRDAASSRKNRAGRIVSKDRARFPRVLTSMDIYERAMLREKLGQTTRERLTRRQRRAVSNQNVTAERENTTRKCMLHELYVNFRDIGLADSIIAPDGYSAFQCKGVCEPPLSQDERPTNHATIQATVHKMGLFEDVESPCCVPIKLRGISILFFKDEKHVVLKVYEDMIASRCGCR